MGNYRPESLFHLKFYIFYSGCTFLQPVVELSNELGFGGGGERAGKEVQLSRLSLPLRLLCRFKLESRVDPIQIQNISQVTGPALGRIETVKLVCVVNV